MTTRMYSDNVLVRMEIHENVERKTSGGLIIPQQVGPRTIDAVWARVVMVGPGHHGIVRCGNCKRILPVDGDARTHPLDFAIGDRVLVDNKESGDRLEYDGVEHRIVRYDECLAVEEAEAAE